MRDIDEVHAIPWTCDECGTAGYETCFSTDRALMQHIRGGHHLQDPVERAAHYKESRAAMLELQAADIERRAAQ